MDSNPGFISACFSSNDASVHILVEHVIYVEQIVNRINECVKSKLMSKQFNKIHAKSLLGYSIDCSKVISVNHDNHFMNKNSELINHLQLWKTTTRVLHSPPLGGRCPLEKNCPP